jgi:hypothetical protein
MQVEFPQNDIGSLFRQYLMYDETLHIGAFGLRRPASGVAVYSQ